MRKKIDKPSVCWETSLDESFLLGTKENLANFANSILKLLDGPYEELEYLGIKVKDPNLSENLTESMSEIVLDGILIVDSTEDQKGLVNKILLNNGESIIDWDGDEGLS